MKYNSKRIIPTIILGFSVSSFIFPVPTTAQPSSGYTCLISDYDYCSHPAITYYCDTVNGPVDDCVLSPNFIHMIPAPFTPFDEYRWLQYCCPPQSAEEFVSQNEHIPLDSFEESDWNKDEGSFHRVRPSDESTWIRPPSIGPSNPGSRSRRAATIDRFPHRRQEDQKRIAAELEDENSLQEDWEFDAPFQDEHAGHDHANHEHHEYDKE